MATTTTTTTMTTTNIRGKRWRPLCASWPWRGMSRRPWTCIAAGTTAQRLPMLLSATNARTSWQRVTMTITAVVAMAVADGTGEVKKQKAVRRARETLGKIEPGARRVRHLEKVVARDATRRWQWGKERETRGDAVHCRRALAAGAEGCRQRCQAIVNGALVRQLLPPH